METGIVAVRYARALFSFAKERRKETRVYDDMKMLWSSFTAEPSLKEALANPVLHSEVKEKLLESAAGIEVSEEYSRFVRLVLTHKRENLMPMICLLYLTFYRKEKRINRMFVETAVPLDPEIGNRLIYELQLQTEGTVELSEHVRPELIGGLVMRMDNYRLDASVASQLKKAQRQLAGKHGLTEKE